MSLTNEDEKGNYPSMKIYVAPKWPEIFEELSGINVARGIIDYCKELKNSATKPR